MAIIKLTFDGSLNTAKQDAYFNYYLTNKQNGIVKGLGNEVAATASNGTITFKDGFVSIYGRRVYVENGTSIKISLDSTKYGYVILKVNTAKNEASIETKEGTSLIYPSLTQQNLLDDDGIYEQALCSYYKTSSSLTIHTNDVTYVRTFGEIMNEVQTNLNAKIAKIQNGIVGVTIARGSKDGVKQTFNISSYVNKSDVLIRFSLCGNVISTSLKQITSTSYGLFIPYYSLGTWYNLEVNYANGTLTLYTGADTHNIKNIFINY